MIIWRRNLVTVHRLTACPNLNLVILCDHCSISDGARITPPTWRTIRLCSNIAVIISDCLSCSSSGQYNNSTCIGFGSSISASNQIQLGTSSETIYCNKISSPNNQILSYSTIPSTVSNQIGYQVSNSRTISISFISNSYINISLCTLPVGIYIIHYSMNLYSITTTSGVVEKSFVEYGISTVSTNCNIQLRKSYFSVPMGLSHSLTNTICYVSRRLTIFLNATLPAQDLTNNSLSASTFYVNNAFVTATRLA